MLTGSLTRLTHCLLMNKTGHLVVCDSFNHRIQVFDLSGKFVAKFGTKGSGMGEFKTPVSAAVLSDGKIVVSEINNSRIQFLNNYDVTYVCLFSGICSAP